MNMKWQKLLGAVAVALWLSTPVMAQRGGGGGGGWGGGGGGWGGDHRDQPGHSYGSGRAPAYRAPVAHPYAGHPVGHDPAYHPHPYYAHWYHGDWHDHWVHPWHYGPAAWFGAGLVAGAMIVDAPWHWGYWSYYNPYYTGVVFVDAVPIDYSQPIVLASTATPISPQVEAEAGQLLDVSRAAFARGDYAEAMRFVNQAIAKKPNDPVPHEFRALILFAQRRYRAATAAIYAVLSVGPGWDWATLCSFYPDPNVYTAQLRALEQYRNQHPNQPDVRFLLAYHYMSCGANDAAVIQLREVVRLNPRDQLATQLLAGLSEPKSAAPVGPAPAAAPAVPVSANRLVGNWEAPRPEGASISLNVTPDSSYHWRYTQNGKTQEFSGTYSVTDNLMILKNQGNPAMIGQVTLVDANHFNFKMVGTPASDPGLTFAKM